MKEISLTQGQVALVDDEDYEFLSKLSFKLDSKGYPRLCGKESIVCLHNLLFPKKERFVIDHIDRNPLNNQKHNLRYVSRAGNLKNSNKYSDYRYTGVALYHHNGKTQWTAQIMLNKIRHYLGRFSTPERAALAYNEAATKHFGDLATLNVI